MTGREVIKKLEKQDFEIVSTNGSHYKLRCGNRMVIVPVHGNKDVKPGTLRSIERQAGVRLK